jgi:hypothetical protein
MDTKSIHMDSDSDSINSNSINSDFINSDFINSNKNDLNLLKKTCVMLNTKYEKLEKSHNNLQLSHDNLEKSHNNLQLYQQNFENNNIRTFDMHMTNGGNILGTCDVIIKQTSNFNRMWYICWAIYLYKNYLSTVMIEISNNPVMQMIIYIIKNKFGINFDMLWKNYMKIRTKFTNFYDFLNKSCEMIIKIYNDKYKNY